MHKRKKKIFRFQAMWMGDNECQMIVEQSWGNSKSDQLMGDVIICIAVCSKNLEVWNKEKFGNV